MQNETALLIDKSGSNRIFEKFASEIEQAKIDGNANYALDSLMRRLQRIERKLQDLSEEINVENENQETNYSITIKLTREILDKWFVLFEKRNIKPDIVETINNELNIIIDYIEKSNISTESVDEVK